MLFGIDSTKQSRNQPWQARKAENIRKKCISGGGTSSIKYGTDFLHHRHLETANIADFGAYWRDRQLSQMTTYQVSFTEVYWLTVREIYTR